MGSEHDGGLFGAVGEDDVIAVGFGVVGGGLIFVWIVGGLLWGDLHGYISWYLNIKYAWSGHSFQKK